MKLQSCNSSIQLVSLNTSSVSMEIGLQSQVMICFHKTHILVIFPEPDNSMNFCVVELMCKIENVLLSIVFNYLHPSNEIYNCKKKKPKVNR